ncbi:hypothetical protein AVEN_152847-1 [Araneus ventricosus]|uniref:Uncharacterized protein n=1 Tax=Araneus ventricosus TaxID=182803 RepID=A0A4Y2NCA0_ARAVE|nr:hypothetical protein AVEN_152847-1 [Araneus ventricosus]
MERDAAPESLLKLYLATARKGARMLVVAGEQVLYVLPCALVLWEKLAIARQTSIYLRIELKMKTTPSSINNFIYEDIEDLYLQLDEEDKEQQTELDDFRPGKKAKTLNNIYYMVYA